MAEAKQNRTNTIATKIANWIYWITCALAAWVVISSFVEPILHPDDIDDLPPMLAFILAALVWASGWLVSKAIQFFAHIP